MRYVLVFDVGTQGTRAIVFSNYGDIVASHKISYDEPYLSPKLDWAEQDPDFYFKHICTCSQEVKKQCGDVWNAIEAVSLTTIRDTAVCVDRNGKPLRPAILWLDKRKASGEPTLSPLRKFLFALTEMTSTVLLQYQKSHCNWIRKNEPEVWQKTHKFMLLSTYLVFKMTGQMKDAVASTVFHGPFDFKHRKWQTTKALTYPVFPIEHEKLCTLVESGETLGQITKTMSEQSGIKEGLPLIATGSDKACEVLGLGCFKNTQLAVGLGTTATVSFTSQTYLEPEQFIPPFCSIIPKAYTPEIEIFRGYWLVSWFKKEFARHEMQKAKELGLSTEEVLNQTLKEVPEGCEGLLFTPYLTPNLTMPHAKGAMVGFSDVHTRHHLYRAIIEGINFALMDGAFTMQRRTQIKFEELRVGGGGSRNDEICQITANMFGLPVVRTQNFEVAALGSAIATFVALGAFQNYDEAADFMVKKEKTFYPNMEKHALYMNIYHHVFKKIYGRLAPLYVKLQHIFNKVERE